MTAAAKGIILRLVPSVSPGGLAMPGTGTGLLLIDFVLKPFLKIGMKFPIVLLIMLSLFYGYIAYFALRSSYGQVVD